MHVPLWSLLDFRRTILFFNLLTPPFFFLPPYLQQRWSSRLISCSCRCTVFFNFILFNLWRCCERRVQAARRPDAERVTSAASVTGVVNYTAQRLHPLSSASTLFTIYRRRRPLRRPREPLGRDSSAFTGC